MTTLLLLLQLVTNAQYATFLQSASDPCNQLWTENMNGIERAGTPGNYAYRALDSAPVVGVPWLGALRYVNALAPGSYTGLPTSCAAPVHPYLVEEWLYVPPMSTEPWPPAPTEPGPGRSLWATHFLPNTDDPLLSCTTALEEWTDVQVGTRVMLRRCDGIYYSAGHSTHSPHRGFRVLQTKPGLPELIE